MAFATAALLQTHIIFLPAAPAVHTNRFRAHEGSTPVPLTVPHQASHRKALHGQRFHPVFTAKKNGTLETLVRHKICHDCSQGLLPSHTGTGVTGKSSHVGAKAENNRSRVASAPCSDMVRLRTVKSFSDLVVVARLRRLVDVVVALLRRHDVLAPLL